jgi:hypothetical protein
VTQYGYQFTWFDTIRQMVIACRPVLVSYFNKSVIKEGYSAS